MLEALILGLIGGLVPGPVLTATLTEILQTGIVGSLRIILLAMITETAVALASLVAISALHLPPSFFYALSLIGAGVLIWLSTSIWKVNSLDTDTKVHFSFQKISAMILANGVLWSFWITVCVPKAIALGHQMFLGEFIFIFLIEIGWLVSTVAVAVIFSRFRRWLSNPAVVPKLFKAFALAFVYFAVSMAIQSITYFARH